MYIHCIICLGKVSEEIEVSSDTGLEKGLISKIIVGILLNACHLVQVEFFIFDLHLLCVRVCYVFVCVWALEETVDSLQERACSSYYLGSRDKN